MTITYHLVRGKHVPGRNRLVHACDMRDTTRVKVLCGRVRPVSVMMPQTLPSETHPLCPWCRSAVGRKAARKPRVNRLKTKESEWKITEEK